LNKVDITQIAQIPVTERILLLPHCLRRTETCKAKYSKAGLECMACNPDCAINKLTKIAIDLGYKGVCVAPGGRLAVNYVNEIRPRAIIAVACQKELEEGIGNVNGLATYYSPLIVIIPLNKDGCVDTEVDVDKAAETIQAGCSLSP